MTCIVGYADGKNVWIGGDSAGVAGLGLAVRADKKVFVRTGKDSEALQEYQMVFGFTSSFRMGQIIRYDMEMPDTAPPSDPDACEKWLVQKFIPKLRSALKSGGFTEITNNEESGGTFLLGVGGNLFGIQGDFQVCRNIVDFDSVGCGSNYALGAMSMVHDWRHPVLKLADALEVAEAWSAGVRGPFHFVSTESDEVQETECEE